VTYQHILYEVNDKIATVTLNRPDRMNAWTAIMERDVRHAMEKAAADNVRVIVLTGAGRAFCAGATIDANREMQIALRGSDFKEGVASFMEKRPPRFTGK
jgi:enoyl-CoA hydratase/carnithine racemase